MNWNNLAYMDKHEANDDTSNNVHVHCSAPIVTGVDRTMALWLRLYINQQAAKSQVLLMCLLLKTYFRKSPFALVFFWKHPVEKCHPGYPLMPFAGKGGYPADGEHAFFEQWQVWAKCLTHIYVQLCAYAHTCNKYMCIIVYIYNYITSWPILDTLQQINSLLVSR